MLAQLLADGLVRGGIIATLAVGFGILFQASRFFVFTFGTSFLWAAYTPLFLREVLPLPLSAFAGLVVAAILGTMLEAGLYRRLRSRGKSSLVLMIASIGAYLVLQNVISLLFGDQTRIIRTWGASESHELWGIRLTTVQLLSLGAALVTLGLTWILLRFTVLGLRLRAVANDALLSTIVGIDVDRSVLLGVCFGSTLAGVAGLLVGIDLDLVPTMGFQALLLGIVGCIIGGTTSLAGAALGGLTLGLFQALGVWSIGTAWQNAIVFAALLLVLIVRPEGLFGDPLDKSKV